MADPQTSNIGLFVPTTGSDVGTWGSVALNPDFVALDGYLGGVQTIGASSTPIALTAPVGFSATPSGGPTQAQNMTLKFTGTLTANVVVTLPLPGSMIIHNLTGTPNGSQLIFAAQAGAGLSISVAQGSIQRIYNDGTNVYFVDLPPIGSFLDLCTTSVPTWINACTVAPYLYCNGSTFNATTYPYLNALMGGNTLPDLRGRSRFAFNDGTSRVTVGVSGINGDVLTSGGGDQLFSAHTHQVTGNTGGESNPHTHALNNGVGFTVGSSSVGNGNASPGAAGPAASISPVTTTESVGHTHGINITSSTSGSGSSQNMPPAAISGIMLIRAG